MKTIKIESKHNPRIKALKKLKEKKHRMKERVFLVEGFRLLEEAFRAKIPVESLFYVAEKETDFQHYIAPHLQEEDVFHVSQEVLKELSDTVHPQGIVGVLSMDHWPQSSSATKDPELYLYLDGLQDPGNLGTIIRSAHAAGCGGILFGKHTVDPYGEKVLRSAMGSLFHVPIYQDGDAHLPQFMAEGYPLAVTSLNATQSIYEEDLRGKLILVIGNEGKGVSKDMEEKATTLLKIPMPGEAESLNAAVATSIILFERVRQKRL